MITTGYRRLMARYNAWQNASLTQAADTLSGEERWRDRGAFFKSIAATFNHLYWADALLLGRIKGDERPEETITHSLTSPAAWETFKALRLARDADIADWAASLGDADLEGQVRWRPGEGSIRIEKPKALCVVQLFNHQTHHRGQIHAMLTAAGARPEPTDVHLLESEPVAAAQNRIAGEKRVGDFAMKHVIPALLVLASLVNLAPPAAAQENGQGTARLEDAGVIGGRRVLALILDLPPGSITYWRNPGDGGVAPELTTVGSDNLAGARMLFPAPRAYSKAGAVAFGYEGRVVFPVEIEASDPKAPVSLKARFDYGVCAKLCLPAQADFALTLAPDAAGEEEARDAAQAGLARIPVPRPLGTGETPAILSVEGKGGGRFSVATRGASALFPEAPEGWWFDPAGQGPDFTLTLAQKPAGAAGPVDVRLTGVGAQGAVETTVRLDAGAGAP